MKAILIHIYFSLYLINLKAALLFYKINPITFFARFFFRENKKKITQYKNNYQNAFLDKSNGIGSAYAGGGVVGLIFLAELSVIHFISSLLGILLKPLWAFYLIPFILAVFIGYVFIFRDNTYIEEFEKIEDLEKKDRIYILIWSLITVVVVVIAFIFSLQEYVSSAEPTD